MCPKVNPAAATAMRLEGIVKAVRRAVTTEIAVLEYSQKVA